MFSLKLKPKSKEIKKAVVSNPKILEINLIKEDSSVSFDWGKNLSTIFLAFFIAAVLVAEIFFGLDWWQNQELIKTQKTVAEISKLNKEIAILNNQANEAFKYKDKVLVLSGLLNNHIYWSGFLSWLERNTLSSVQYESFKGDLSGSYSLNATAKTYADVSWQVKAFLNDPMTKAASVGQATTIKLKDNDKEKKAPQVDFILNLEVNPAIFKK
ncbi:MAG: hypothetical protein ACYC40_00510 [Patescibacteria group bacterium]